MDMVEYKKAKSRFFVRTQEPKDAVEKQFGQVEWVEAEGITGENGFLTEIMTEEEYEEKALGLKNILQRIRVV